MSNAPSSQGSLPSTALEFGAGLRALRGVSLRDLEARQPQVRDALVLSKSQLQRYETGQLLPPLSYADHLDGLYNANGWVKVSLSALYAATWDPWAEHQTPSAPANAHEWPATYRGPVWIVIKPHPENAGNAHTVTLDWGAWSAALTLAVGTKGLVLTTGKSLDRSGVAVTFNLESDLPVFTLFGVGAPPSGYPVTKHPSEVALRRCSPAPMAAIATAPGIERRLREEGGGVVLAVGGRRVVGSVPATG